MDRRAALFALLVVVADARAQGRTTRPVAPPRRPAPPRERYPAVALYGAHVGEALTYRPLDDRGRARRDAVRSLERLLRCRQTGARHRLHPRLGAALYQIGRHFAGHRIEIYSGYRPRAFCDRAHSRHMSGSAIDFHVDGVDNEALVAFLRKTFHPAGVGFYPRGVHVHLDVERGVDTYWVDPGRPAHDPTAEPEARDSAPLPLPAAPLDAEAEGAEPEAAAVPTPGSLGEPPATDPLIDPDP